MMKNCDTLLMVGTCFPYAEWLPEPGQARGVQIDIDARMPSAAYPMEVHLVGDAGDAARARCRSSRAQGRPLLARGDRGRDRALVADLDDRARPRRRPDQPAARLPRAQQAAARRAILTSDSGSAANWWAATCGCAAACGRALGHAGDDGPALPYALAAKFAYPDRPVIAPLGDGAMQMLGINALINIARYYERWDNPRLVVLVLNNNDLNQVTWEQRVPPATRARGFASCPRFPYASTPSSSGSRYPRRRQDEVPGAWDEAMAADRPVVLEA